MRQQIRQLSLPRLRQEGVDAANKLVIKLRVYYVRSPNPYSTFSFELIKT